MLLFLLLLTDEATKSTFPNRDSLWLMVGRENMIQKRRMSMKEVIMVRGRENKFLFGEYGAGVFLL